MIFNNFHGKQNSKQISTGDIKIYIFYWDLNNISTPYTTTKVVYKMGKYGANADLPYFVIYGPEKN